MTKVEQTVRAAIQQPRDTSKTNGVQYVNFRMTPQEMELLKRVSEQMNVHRTTCARTLLLAALQEALAVIERDGSKGAQAHP